MASLQRTTLTIANGAAVSSELSGDSLRNARAISIQAPAALTGTVSLQSADDDLPSGTTFATVQSPPGTDITIAAGKTTVLTALPFPRVRLQSSVNEGGTRVFVVTIQMGE